MNAMNQHLNPEIIRVNEKDEFPTPEMCHIIESWNDESDSVVSIARARVPIGVTTKLHRINGCDERYLITQGVGKILVGDMEPEFIKPGDVVIIPEGIPQKITNTGQQNLVFYCICSPRFKPEYYEALE